MQIHLLKSKIHRAAVTDSNLNYEGSMSIAQDLMEQVGMLPYERILCSNLSNGERFETYVMPGEPGTGSIVLNGATSHLGKAGDRLTIMSFAAVGNEEAENWKPRVIVLGEKNLVLHRRGI